LDAGRALRALTKARTQSGAAASTAATTRTAGQRPEFVIAFTEVPPFRSHFSGGDHTKGGRRCRIGAGWIWTGRLTKKVAEALRRLRPQRCSTRNPRGAEHAGRTALARLAPTPTGSPARAATLDFLSCPRRPPRDAEFCRLYHYESLRQAMLSINRQARLMATYTNPHWPGAMCEAVSGAVLPGFVWIIHSQQVVARIGTRAVVARRQGIYPKRERVSSVECLSPGALALVCATLIQFRRREPLS
jgi:hypothetical protein